MIYVKPGSRHSLRQSLDSFRIGPLANFLLILISAIVGFALYFVLINTLYAHLYNACLSSDAVNEAFSEIPSGRQTDSGPLTQGETFKLLDHFGLLTDEEKTPADLFGSALSPNYVVGMSLMDLKGDDLRSTARLVWRLAQRGQANDQKKPIERGKQCNYDTARCEEFYSALVAGSVAQLPTKHSVTGDSLSFIKDESAQGRIERSGLEGVFGLQEPRDSKYGVLYFIFIGPNAWRFEKPMPEATAEQVAKSVTSWWPPHANDPFDWQVDVQRTALQRCLAVLMAKMRGVPQVRDARILVNGIIGPERCAVIILAVYFTLRLIQRSLARRKHERARLEIMNSLLSMPEESKWLPLTARIASTRPVLSKLKRLETTIPYIILKAAFDQMEARADASVAEGKPSNDYVGIRASQERQELDGSRTVLDILLPTFPAIGFIGTVRSLLIAMSQADKIVSTTDPFAKGLAASQVTDILSLCFSTTFLALCAVLVFSPLSLLQQSREHRLVDDVYRLIEIVLRPNQ